jgi:hypothetical protein
MPNGLPRSGKTLQPIPLPVSFALESLTKKFDLVQEKFVEDLCLYITKGYHPLKSTNRVKAWYNT